MTRAKGNGIFVFEWFFRRGGGVEILISGIKGKIHEAPSNHTKLVKFVHGRFGNSLYYELYYREFIKRSVHLGVWIL